MMHPLFFLRSDFVNLDQVDLGNVNSDRFIVNINEEEETCRVLTHVGFYPSVSQFRCAKCDVFRKPEHETSSIDHCSVDDFDVFRFDNVLCHDKLPPK